MTYEQVFKRLAKQKIKEYTPINCLIANCKRKASFQAQLSAFTKCQYLCWYHARKAYNVQPIKKTQKFK